MGSAPISWCAHCDAYVKLINPYIPTYIQPCMQTGLYTNIIYTNRRTNSEIQGDHTVLSSSFKQGCNHASWIGRIPRPLRAVIIILWISWLSQYGPRRRLMCTIVESWTLHYLVIAVTQRQRILAVLLQRQRGSVYLQSTLIILLFYIKCEGEWRSACQTTLPSCVWCAILLPLLARES